MRSLSPRARRNPVLFREVQERMRTPRVILLLTAYLGLLGAIVVGIYYARTGDGTGAFGQPGITRMADIGQSVFEFVLFFMMLLVLFIVPGYTAPAIAGERERQTLTTLQMTMLRPRNIVFGKVSASIAFTILLLVATLPLLTVAYLIGGITIKEVFVGLGAVLFTAVAVACITVGCSARMKRVQGAIIVSYGLILLLIGGTFLAFSVASEIDSSRGVDAANPTTWILAPNPFAAIAELADDGPQPIVSEGDIFFGPFGPTLPSTSSSPLGAIREFMRPSNNSNFGPFGPFGPEPIRFDRFGQPVFAEEDVEVDGLPLWARSGIVLGALSLVGLVVATRSIRTPSRAEN